MPLGGSGCPGAAVRRAFEGPNTYVITDGLSDSQTGSHLGDPKGSWPSSSKFFGASSSPANFGELKALPSRRTGRHITDYEWLVG